MEDIMADTKSSNKADAKHPRDEDGRFADKGGSAKSSGSGQGQSPKSKEGDSRSGSSKSR